MHSIASTPRVALPRRDDAADEGLTCPSDILSRPGRKEIRPERQHLRRLDAPYETYPAEHHQHPPAGIALAFVEAEPGRPWERVVIIVPGFSHGHKPAVGYVVTLHTCALDMPGTRTLVMSEIANQPMAGHADRHPHTNSPDHPGHPADGEEQRGPG